MLSPIKDELYDSESENDNIQGETDDMKYKDSNDEDDTTGSAKSLDRTWIPTPKKETQTKQKQRKRSKKESIVSVAPGEGGRLINITNFEKFKYLEEECFPHLFPDGEGGYVSTYLPKGKENPGLANYLRARMYSVDPRFRLDSHYVMFATLLKEAVGMKNCEVTAFRKAQRLPKYDKNFINEADKAELLRSHQSYKHFRAMRGFAPYYQSHGLDLMAFIRQQGTPQVYQTLSQAQLRWDELLLAILKTMNNTEYKWSSPLKNILDNANDEGMTLEFVKKLEPQDRRCLVVNNIQQVTQHFQKRVQKVFKALKQDNFIIMKTEAEKEHEQSEENCNSTDGKDDKDRTQIKEMAWSIEDYFIKTEFTAGGFPHVHCLCWLVNKLDLKEREIMIDGIIQIKKFSAEAPIFDNTVEGKSGKARDEGKEKVCQLADQIMKGTKTEFKGVDPFQMNHHTFTCHKKKKRCVIYPWEGHEVTVSKREIKNSPKLTYLSCRFHFPQFPMKETTMLEPHTDHDSEEYKTGKEDLRRIRTYMIRQTMETKSDPNPKAREDFFKLEYDDFL